MKKILGLDLGTNSIGWAFLKGTGDNAEIKTGVRIIPLTKDEVSEFNAGQAISTNATRTQKRGMRRNLDRYQQRRRKLRILFDQYGWLPLSEDHKLIGTNAIWELRARAAEEEISLKELALVLLHINKKRGFKSNRKGSTEDSDTAFKQAIKESDRAVLELGYTIGQWVWEQINERESVGEKVFTNITFSRSVHYQEFEKIWEVQSWFHDDLNDSIKREVGDFTIFHQRPLKSQKGKLSNCLFYPNRKVIAESHPLFQLFRAWHDVNNLEITLAVDRSKVLLSEEEDLDLRRALVLALQNSERQTDKQLSKVVAKELGGKQSDYMLNLEKISGCSTRHNILKVLKKHSQNTAAFETFDPFMAGDNFDKQPLLQLWHALYSIDDPEFLKATLKKNFGFEGDELLNDLMSVKISERYSSLSAKAIKELLAYMQEGSRYDKAAEKAGLRHSDYETKEEKEQRELKATLEMIPKGQLRNPVVEKILNQVVQVVNAIIENPEQGRPDEIHVEMGRELTATSKQRSNMKSAIAKTTRETERIKDILTNEFGIKRPSRNDVLKYRLGEECQWISLYTGNAISKEAVFITGEFDIEHIIPKSRLFDDSYGNKTLCESEVNREKGNMTAFDYMASKGEAALEQYIDRVKSLSIFGGAKLISRSKEQKLMMKREEIPSDFISRQMNDSRYIARVATSMMKQISKDVITTSGALTSYLRNEWGLEDILRELNFHKYEAIGQTEEITLKSGKKIKRIVDWSKRDDHRHHAMDALVVALSTRAMVQKANNLNSYMGDYGDFNATLKEGARKFECPVPNIREKAKQALAETLVSIKPGKRLATNSRNIVKQRGGKSHVTTQVIPRGPLHKETVYGKNRRYVEKPLPLAKISDAELIVDENARMLFKEQLAKYGGDPKKAFSSAVLKKTPFKVQGKEVSELTCFEEYFTVRVAVNEGLKVEKVVDDRIREKLQERLMEFGGSPKKAFVDLDANPIWFDEDRKIPIKKVRIRTSGNDLLALRTSEETALPKDYVETRNNHHIAVYRQPDGKLTSRLVTFIEAVNRKQQGVEVIQKQLPDGSEYVQHYMMNEYFVFADEMPDDPVELSEKLYRVQKLSSTGDGKVNISFRHQLETGIERSEKFALQHIQSISKLPWIKVKISHDGKVSKL